MLSLASSVRSWLIVRMGRDVAGKGSAGLLEPHRSGATTLEGVVGVEEQACSSLGRLARGDAPS